MATVLLGGKRPELITQAEEASGRLLDAMTYWGQEAAWWDHRITRLTWERDALDAWLDARPSSAWDAEPYRRRYLRALEVWRQREIAKLRLKEIAAKVHALTKGSAKLGQLTERFYATRRDPAPATRPGAWQATAEEWAQAKGRGWKVQPES